MTFASRTRLRRSVTGALIRPDGRVSGSVRNRRGAIIVLVSLLLLSMVGLMVLAVDFGRLDSLKADLQKSADAAALAGAVEMIDAVRYPLPVRFPDVAAGNWVAKNPAMGAVVTVDSVVCGSFTDVDTTGFLRSFGSCAGSGGGTLNAVEVSVSRQSSGLFLAAFGVSPPVLHARATAAVSPDTSVFPPYSACLHPPANDCRVYLVPNRPPSP